MNKLLKYILFVNLPFIIFPAITLLVAFFVGKIGTDGSIAHLVEDLLQFATLYIVLAGFPLIAVILSAIYQYRNPSFKEYGKSLFITLSFVAVFLFSILAYLFLKGSFENFSMEGGQLIGILVLISMAILISSAIINLVTLFVSEHFSKRQ